MSNTFTSPLLAATVTRDPQADSLTLTTTRGIEYEVSHPSLTDFEKVLRSLDGTRSREELAKMSNLPLSEIADILRQLDSANLLDDPPSARGTKRAIEVQLELEGLINDGFETYVEGGRFWRNLSTSPAAVPENVYYGFALQNWHFLYRENLFDSAILTFPSNSAVRKRVNEFYIEEHQHDDIVLEAFSAIGLTPDQVRRSRPLRTTTALVNALGWWARTDPVFFFSTISSLEGGVAAREDTDSFIEAAETKGVPAAFIEPLRRHAAINNGHDHGSVSRQIMAMLPAQDERTIARLKGQVPLFIELYRDFYDGVYDYYSEPSYSLIRELP
ncbi:MULTISPECIES: hypothetical protein [Rhodococcus]|uniref:hypothetical protein n=1 Tax=Rhodococcus TaxID=1827 RepID=UPI0010203F13|nr:MULTISPECIES: hypothetical protein [Rhodococcus]UTT50969.1 hypothetical protein NMQ04_21765 [Rhodococcus gordoniae]